MNRAFRTLEVGEVISIYNRDSGWMVVRITCNKTDSDGDMEAKMIGDNDDNYSNVWVNRKSKIQMFGRQLDDACLI